MPSGVDRLNALDRVPGHRRRLSRPGSGWRWSTRTAGWPTTRSPRASATTATPRWPTRPPGRGRPTSGAGTARTAAPPDRSCSAPASPATSLRHGSAPPSVTIPAGRTRSVTCVARTPAPRVTSPVAGVTPAGQPAQTVPVTLRALAPTEADQLLRRAHRRQRAGLVHRRDRVLPGRRGRRARPDSTPRSTLADNPNNQTYAWLVDPSGQAQAFQSNGARHRRQLREPRPTPTRSVRPRTCSSRPRGGGRSSSTFAPTVSGTALREPFTVSVNQTAETVTATGVPHGRPIDVNHPAVVQVKVTNHSDRTRGLLRRRAHRPRRRGTT